MPFIKRCSSYLVQALIHRQHPTPAKGQAIVESAMTAFWGFGDGGRWIEIRD
jgi:hypothetical protein